MNTINKNMILIRSALNLSQREFADLAGVASSTVSAWELGNSIPRTRPLIRISERVDVTVEELKEKELTPTDIVYTSNIFLEETKHMPDLEGCLTYNIENEEYRMNNKCMSENLKIIRKALGLTQSEFGQMIGVSAASSVSAWEMGDAMPRFKVLHVLSEKTGVPEDIIMRVPLTIDAVRKYGVGETPEIHSSYFIFKDTCLDETKETELRCLFNICDELPVKDILMLTSMAKHLKSYHHS